MNDQPRPPGSRDPDQRAGPSGRAPAASRRDRTPGELDRKSGERDRKSGGRDAPAGQRERDLDEHERGLGAAVEGMERQTAHTIDRSRALVDATRQHLGRRNAADQRPDRRREREQAEVDREAAEGARRGGLWPPGARGQIERAKALREQAVAAIEAFARTEEEIALLHEQLAAASPTDRGEYLRIAGNARDGARKARDLLQAFPG